MKTEISMWQLSLFILSSFQNEMLNRLFLLSCFFLSSLLLCPLQWHRRVQEEGNGRGERHGGSRVGCDEEPEALPLHRCFSSFVLPASIAPRQELGKAFSGCIPQLFGWGGPGRGQMLGTGGMRTPLSCSPNPSPTFPTLVQAELLV